ncbi:FKBP-type peptidyl-prolyl cis-trans isomerase [Actinomadura graeca]|uniref:Peptidyl-prolyl cis-trans isomerase n=1 Tax=Actinomadura graeca TaxID=2750812 RepID=A0ABX8QPN9_9ACTN|nr:FKBP-type peptidyl-prolyl cis-trans isomerase [Actinomadura graeca]QXJ19884.1 FKBP-type peptidyl-prolyl cis-trans isomerase [Actinomadura graeca]
MRSRSAVVSVAVLLAVPSVFAAGCSDGGGVRVTVRGDFGRLPEVSFPKGAPGGSLAVKTLSDGRGAGARKGDLVVADYVGYRWSRSGRKLLASSFAAGRPEAFPTWGVVPGLRRAFEGARVGSRVVASIPPKDGFGEQGNAARQIGGDDTLVYVLDVRGVYSASAGPHGRAEPPLGDPGLPRVSGGGAPSVTVPRAAPPKGLVVRTLVLGDGPVVRKGQLLAVQYAGFFWRDGRTFGSSWAAGHPNGVTVGTGQVMKGWDQGLVGQRVGSRMLLVVPPSLGYGAKGLAQAGIKGSDTLVFVVDVLGAH